MYMLIIDKSAILSLDVSVKSMILAVIAYLTPPNMTSNSVESVQ